LFDLIYHVFWFLSGLNGTKKLSHSMRDQRSVNGLNAINELAMARANHNVSIVFKTVIYKTYHTINQPEVKAYETYIAP
jgi:hypothetical protein